MDRLIKLSELKIKNLKNDFKRYLYDQINWNSKLIIITGARGSGKTTLLLQKMKSKNQQAVYLSLDDFYFESNRLLLLIDQLYGNGVRNFFLDEVHQYEHWSSDLKNIYDSYDDIQVVATGSSVLKINKGQADLSRRAELYMLKGLSFREFLELHQSIKIETFSLEKIIKQHQEISIAINDVVDVLKYFKYYLSYGYYPFSMENKQTYHMKLQQITQLILDVDIPAVESINYPTIRSMKKLLYIIGQLVPYIPNIQSLSKKVGTSRNSILKALDLMDHAQILNLLKISNLGVSQLQKPEKIYLENPNLAFALSGSNPNLGNLRETFFMNQLSVKHVITAPKFGDFLVDHQYLFEIGGANKTNKQIAGIPSSYIAADEIKNGENNKIPLWLFGFLY